MSEYKNITQLHSIEELVLKLEKFYNSDEFWDLVHGSFDRFIKDIHIKNEKVSNVFYLNFGFAFDTYTEYRFKASKEYNGRILISVIERTIPSTSIHIFTTKETECNDFISGRMKSLLVELYYFAFPL